jgi:hypothetical protein
MVAAKTLNYAEHPALKAIVKRRDRYCHDYPPTQWSSAYLLGFVEAFDAAQQVLSPVHITMPSAPFASVDTLPQGEDREDGLRAEQG